MVLTLKQARTLQGITQGEIAEQLGVSIYYYRKMEAHPEDLTVEEALQLCGMLGVSYDQISFSNSSSQTRGRILPFPNRK